MHTALRFARLRILVAVIFLCLLSPILSYYFLCSYVVCASLRRNVPSVCTHYFYILTPRFRCSCLCYYIADHPSPTLPSTYPRHASHYYCVGKFPY